MIRYSRDDMMRYVSAPRRAIGWAALAYAEGVVRAWRRDAETPRLRQSVAEIVERTLEAVARGEADSSWRAMSDEIYARLVADLGAGDLGRMREIIEAETSRLRYAMDVGAPVHTTGDRVAPPWAQALEV